MDHFFKGKRVVVTGRMGSTRTVIYAQLTSVGAIVQMAVDNQTDYLICGKDVGKNKTSAAEAKGIKMLNANDYYQIMDKGQAMGSASYEVKPKLTHEEYVASLPETYGGW